jgi:predicted metal-dependent hydrolase
MKIDRLIRSKRKSIALIVDREGQLLVRAPLKASAYQIEDFVAKKADWIHTAQKKVRLTYQKVRPKEYVNGEGFLFLGKIYPLEIAARANHPLVLDGGFILKKNYLPKAEQIFTRWYREQARLFISERVAWFARQYEFAYKQIKITSARTRWGSCSSRGSLNFAWRLVMAPKEIIDYVVVHELVHTIEKSHRKLFWGKVAAILPGYKQQKEWLKINGHTLTLG